MNLQPVDFKAVAAKGAYVYCYLRSSDQSPYYVGMSSKRNGSRPFEPHACFIPGEDCLVRVMRSGLTVEEAYAWERFYIARYGIRSEGGLLNNQTYGGEGIHGYKFTEEQKAKLSLIGKANKAENRDRQTRAIAEQLELNGSCSAQQYQEMSYKDRQAFRKYLERKPKGTLANWKNQTPSEYVKEGALKRSEKAAKAVGATLDQWTALSKSHRIAVRAWLKRNPENTFQDWIEGVRQVHSGPKLGSTFA